MKTLKLHVELEKHTHTYMPAHTHTTWFLLPGHEMDLAFANIFKKVSFRSNVELVQTC